jgi:hypothetical protein
LLTTYRNASEAGKSALNKVASAIRTQTMSAWFSAGMAVSEAANIFDKKKSLIAINKTGIANAMPIIFLHQPVLASPKL